MQSIVMPDHQSTLDDRGRITIKPEYREALGTRIVQVRLIDGVLLRPAATRLRHPERLANKGRFSGDEHAMRDLD